MTPEDMARLHAAAMVTPPPWSVRAFDDLLRAPGTFATGDARAFAMGRVVIDEAELLTIATHPAHRRQGLGLACLGRFHALAQKMGAQRAILEVAADNKAAQTLYAADGYERIGQRRGYYRRSDGPPVDAILMARPLLSP